MIAAYVTVLTLVTLAVGFLVGYLFGHHAGIKCALKELRGNLRYEQQRQMARKGSGAIS